MYVDIFSKISGKSSLKIYKPNIYYKCTEIIVVGFSSWLGSINCSQQFMSLQTKIEAEEANSLLI